MHTILIIEDEPDLASVLRLVVSRMGHRALLASTLAEAQAIWSALKQEITVVISDNHLPDGSGIDFGTQLLADKPGLKLILATGNPYSIAPPEAVLLNKPFNMAELLSILDRIE